MIMKTIVKISQKEGEVKMKRKTALKMRKGFTLIELLIVVAIIAILAAIAVPNFLEAQTRSKVSRVLNDMRTVAVAIQAYTVDNNIPPVPYAGNIWQQNIQTGQVLAWAGIQLTTPIAYITTLPMDI